MSLAPLHKYLLEAFESNEALRSFLVMFAEELGPALPDPGANRETFTFRTLEVLRARGYFLDDALFTALAERDPRRRAQVAALAAPYLGQASVVEPLRVLFLAADPTDYDELELGKEATLVEDALGARRVRDRVRAAFEIGRVAVEAKGLRGADLPQLSAAPDADPRRLVLLP